MSVSKDLLLTFLMFNAVYLLVPFFLLHTFRLFWTAMWAEASLKQLLQNIYVVEDDISLPHPPGFFDFTRKDSATDSVDAAHCSGGHSSTTETSITDSSIESNTTSEMTCAELSVMLGYEATRDCLGRLLSECENNGAIGKEVVEDGLHPTPAPSVPNTLLILDVLNSLGSIQSLDITEQHINIAPTLSQPSVSVASQLADQDQELDDIDLSEGETVLRPQPSLGLPFMGPAAMPRAVEETPIFSRHNITDKVIFPVRKCSLIQFRGNLAVKPKDTSVFKRFSATWIRTKEVQRLDLAEAMRSTLVGIRSSTIFNKEEVSSVTDRDPYDSWPYIRTEVEQGINKEALEHEEEGSSVTGLKWPW